MRLGSQLQCSCPAHDGIGAVDRDIDPCSGVVRDIDLAVYLLTEVMVVRIDVAKQRDQFVANLFAGLIVEVCSVKQVAKNAQYFPGGPGLPWRTRDPVKALPAALSIDIGSG